MIIDAHIHCGDNPRTKFFDSELVRKNLDDAGADGAVLFAFPEDMYRIVDTREERIRANKHILQVCRGNPDLHPFYFVWNDFLIPDNLSEYRGIKWHRHADEPRYDYSSAKCTAMRAEISKRGLPVLLEEEFSNTLAFVRDNPEMKIIIPHMGLLNGGTERMDVFFDNPNVYFDTAVAPPGAIKRVLSEVGSERVIFGSDVSGTAEPFFNYTKVEARKLEALELTDAEKENICAKNILRLMKRSID
jgi:predicted TIM-barrel fold metal-dependent hydrolase